MPSRLIYLHNDEIFSKFLRDLLEKKIHHFCISIGQYERCHLSQLWSYSHVGINILSHLLFRHYWSDSRGAPASTYLTQTTESSFICCHEQYRSSIFWLSGFYDLFDLLLKVFLKSSCCCRSALMW